MAEEATIKENTSTPEAKNVEVFADERTVYELGFHIIPTLAEEKIVETFGEFKALIEKNKGIFIAEEAPKSVRLAYTIVKSEGGKRQKFDTTFFGWIKFEMSPENAVSLKEALRAHDALLRCLLFKTARESTLAPKKVFLEKKEARPAPKILAKPKVKKEIPKETISEEELDKTIEELVSET